MGIRKYSRPPRAPSRRRAGPRRSPASPRVAPAPAQEDRGRNNRGRITVLREGGNKRRYRVIDWKRNKDGVPARVATIEYDPNRTYFIALLHYQDGEKAYILAPLGLEVGQTVTNGTGSEPLPGNAMMLKDIPVGVTVHNIELMPGRGGQLCRSAGCGAQLQAKEGDYAAILMPSGELRRIHVTCRATVGRIGNTDHQNVKLGKAGRKRHRGRRPHVRGTALNPVDHPMGGGEGRTAGAVTLLASASSPRAAVRVEEPPDQRLHHPPSQEVTRAGPRHQRSRAQPWEQYQEGTLRRPAGRRSRAGRGGQEPHQDWARACTIFPSSSDTSSWSTTDEPPKVRSPRTWSGTSSASSRHPHLPRPHQEGGPQGRPLSRARRTT